MFFRNIVLFLDDGFADLPSEFTSLEDGAGFGLLNNFLCDVVEVADECLGLFEEESICFGFDLFSRFIKIRYGRSFRKRGETKCLCLFYTADPIAQVGLHAPVHQSVVKFFFRNDRFRAARSRADWKNLGTARSNIFLVAPSRLSERTTPNAAETAVANKGQISQTLPSGRIVCPR